MRSELEIKNEIAKIKQQLQKEPSHETAIVLLTTLEILNWTLESEE